MLAQMESLDFKYLYLFTGADATDNGGGGSGGAIQLKCTRLLGTGAILARGGAGSGTGGGGGGGRVALEYDSTSFTGVVLANGGLGGGQSDAVDVVVPSGRQQTSSRGG